MSFDPDAFLARYGSQAPAFDPDKWLEENDPDKQSGLRDAANTLLRGAHEGWTGALEGVDRMVANVPELMGSAIEGYTRLRQSGIDADLPEAEKQRQLETIQRNTQQIRPEIAQSGAFGRAALGVMDYAKADADKLQARRQKVNEALPVDADFQESTVGGVITGLGQIASQIPLYLTGLGLPASAAQMYDQGYQDAKQNGADEGTAAMAGIGNMPGAALEFAADKLQLGPVLDLVRKGKAPPTTLLTSLAEKMGMGGRLGKAATGVAGAAATEAGTEAVQQVQSNAVAQALYDPDRELTEGAGQAALIGGLTGGTVRGLAEGASAALAPRQPAKAPLDTGMNVPESIETLKAQQQQLVEGRRPAMMFPAGSQEALQVPEGFERLETPRGIFHFDPDQITPQQIQAASAAGKENEILGLGPVSKPEAMARAAQGDPLVSVTERAADGTEVKGALATQTTADQVRKALQADATPGNEIAVESPEETILARIQARNDKKQAEARAAAEAEEEARQARQAELKAKQAQFESTLGAARSLAAAPDADYAALSGALNSLTSYAEDNSLGLRQDQRNEALAQIAKLAPRAEAAKAKFEQESAQRTAEAKAQADAAVQAQKAKIAADQAAVKQQAAAGIGADGKLDYARLDEQDLERRAVDGDERAGKELMRRAELDQDPRESLLDALREVKLPTDDKGLGAELELVKEDMTPRQRLQLLRKGSMSLDQVAEALRGRGFTSIQTPDDVLTYTQRALRGENIRADRASQEQMGDVSYAVGTPKADPAPRELSDRQIDQQWKGLRKALGPIAQEFDLRMGIVADVLQDEGYGREAALVRAGKLGAIQAATAARQPARVRELKAQRQFIVVAATEAKKAKAPGLLLHELAHPFFDTLPQDTREVLREMHAEETTNKTGPLYADGKKTTDIAITAEEFMDGRIQADPDLPVKEWFAERTRRLNESWLEGRVAAAEDPALRRLWRQFIEQLQRIWAQVRGMTPDEDLFQDTFREWLASGTKANLATRATAYAQRQRPQYAKQGVRFATEKPPAGDVDAETGEPNYIPTLRAVQFARNRLGSDGLAKLVRERTKNYDNTDPGTQAILVETIAREAVRAAQTGADVESAIKAETARLHEQYRKTAARAGRNIDFAANEARKGEAAAGPDRNTSLQRLAEWTRKYKTFAEWNSADYNSPGRLIRQRASQAGITQNYELRIAPTTTLRPTQGGEDYLNASSRETARRIADGTAQENRPEDLLPVLLEKDGRTIKDGNHRHAAATINGDREMMVLVPTGPGTGTVTNLRQMWQELSAKIEFATGELFEGDAAGDADRTTTGDYLEAAEKFRNETREVPPGSPLNGLEVRQLAPYLISGNKGDIVGTHGAFITKLAQGAKKVVDAFGGAAIYSHFLANQGALPKGSQWNEWEYTRSITNRQLANNTEAVIAELERIKTEYLAAFPRESLPSNRDEMLAMRRRALDWMQQRLVDLVPNPANDAQGRLILPDSPGMAAFYLFAQNHMAENRVVDIELRNGRATFTTGGKVNGKDDFKFIAEDSKTKTPEWMEPARIWGADAAAKLKTAAARLKQLEVTQGDGWKLAADAENGSLVFVDSSYFQSDKDLAEGKEVMNYGSATLNDGNWPDWLAKFQEQLAPRGNDVRYVVTNNFNNQVVAELEKAGWTVLRTSRTNKTGIAHELLALSPAAANAAEIERQPTRSAPAATLGNRGGNSARRLPGGQTAADTGTDLDLSGDRGRIERTAEQETEPRAELARAQAELASLQEGIDQAEPGEIESRGKQLQARIDALTSQIKQADKRQQMEDLVSASIKPASALRAPKAKPDPDAVIRQAARVTPLPKIDRKAALLQEWREAKKLRDEGNRTGNETAFSEGQIRVNQMKARLDDEFPGWEAEAYPPKTSAPAGVAQQQKQSDADKRGENKPAGAASLEQRESIVAQDDGRNLPPAPPSEPNEKAPDPEDEPAPDRGRAADVYGHTAYTPTRAEKAKDFVRSAIVGIRGPIPELPALPALAKKSDRFIREKGERFYNRLKEFYRVLQSGNDYVQRTAQDQVDVITSGLLRAGGRFSAKDYKTLQERRTQVRKLKADGEPIPAGVKAEIAALQARLEDHPYVLFNRTVVFLDFDWRAKNLKDSAGNPITLPEGLNATEIANELARLGRKIQASPHKDAIARALDQHMSLVESVAQDLKDRELLAAEHLNNPYYFPHLTLEVSQGDKVVQRELRPERVRVGTEADFRGYLVDPVGSKKPVETDYVRAMYYHLVQVGAHNLKADAVKHYAKTYDVRAEVEKTAKALSKQRGSPVSWEQAFHEEYAPQGYVMYGTDSRDAFPTVMVDRDKLARRLGAVLTSADLQEQLRELGLRGITLQPDDLRETLIQGQREVWIVPARVAEALRGIADRQTRSDRPIEAALKRLNGWWKAWKLFMPQNHLRYEYGNVVADIEKVFSASPKTFRYLPQAAKEVREMFAGGPITADLRAAIKEGAINSITAQEMNQLSRLRAFEKFQTVAEKIRDGIKRRGSSALYQPITNLAGLGDLSSVELSAFREGVTRYANFLANLEAIRNNARPDYAGAYWKDIEAMQDSAPGAGDRAVRQAAQISKATFGDYADLSDTGQYLRDKLIPFYSWMEINFKYHANLFRNLRDLVTDARMTKGEAAGAAARAAGALVAGTGAKLAGGVLLRLALPYLAVSIWNNSGGREELEDELSEEDRRRFHIIVGRDDDGKVQVIYANTAFADVTKWFSGPKFAQAMAGWIDGRTDFLTAVKDWTSQIGPDLANNTLGSAGPLAKIAVAATLKKATFPDVLDPRTIPAYDMRRHVIGQVTDDFTADLIERVVNKDYMPAKDLGDWAQQLVLQVRQRDPEQWAFYAIKDKAADFHEERTGKSRDSSYDAPDQQVLRNFRKAIYQGNLEEASKFYLRLLDLGYTAERFAASIRAQDPLSALPKADRREFVEQLDPIDTEMLRRAYAYYARMSGNRGMERRLFPSERTGPAGADAYQTNPRLDWVRKALQDTATMTEEDVQKRVDRDLRNSLQTRR